MVRYATSLNDTIPLAHILLPIMHACVTHILSTASMACFMSDLPKKNYRATNIHAESRVCNPLPAISSLKLSESKEAYLYEGPWFHVPNFHFVSLAASDAQVLGQRHGQHGMVMFIGPHTLPRRRHPHCQPRHTLEGSINLPRRAN